MDTDKARNAVESRFVTAATGEPPTDAQRESLSEIITNVTQLAFIVELHVPDGRDKSIALTALEDVLMRASRGLFTAR